MHAWLCHQFAFRAPWQIRRLWNRDYYWVVFIAQHTTTSLNMWRMCEGIQGQEHLTSWDWTPCQGVVNNRESHFGELGGQLWRAITQLVYVRFEKFKKSVKGNVKHYMFVSGNIRESMKICEIRKNFMHAVLQYIKTHLRELSKTLQ